MRDKLKYGLSKLDYQRKWKEENREKCSSYSRKYKDKLKQDVMNYYSKGKIRCSDCGIDDIDVLTIDHLNGKGNQHRKFLGFSNGCGLAFYRWLRRETYPTGYRVLCFNCNMKRAILIQRNSLGEKRLRNGENA